MKENKKKTKSSTKLNLNQDYSFLKSFLDYSKEAFILVNNRGLIEFWGGAAGSIFGFSERSIKNKHIGALISDYEKNKNVLVRAILSEKSLIDYETYLLTKNGTEIFTNISLYPIKLKGKKSLYFLLVVQDNTEEKNFQDKFNQLQNLHTEILENVNIGLLIIDKETYDILFTNKKGMDLLQISSSENLGRKIWDLIDSESISTLEKIFNEGFTLDRSPYLIKMQRYHDKRKIWTNLYPAEITYHRRPCYLIAFIDVSKEKDYIKSLEETVKQKDLLAATKSRFMANMSHELRSPINIILGYVDILISMDIDGDLKEFLTYIQKSAEHLLKVLNDILDLSKAEASKIKIIEKPYNLIALMKSVLSMIEVKLIGKKVALDYNSNIEPDAYFLIDAHNLQRVLLNILDNAVKFTEEGLISVDVRYNDGMLVFKISDTGIGMTQEELNRLFIPFEQAPEISQKYGGSGLGLAISKEIINLWKGDIKIESKKNVGTTVTFTYPASRTEQIEEAEVVQIPKDLSIIKGKKILVVDDQEYNHKLFKLMLTECEVETVFSGKLALNKLITEEYDGIVLDLRLPDIPGMEVIKEIKKRERLQNLKIVTTSADILSGLKEQMEEMGIIFIPKPIRRADLLNALITVFSQDQKTK
ncbi:MAG: ATP-binding protein [Ignavibacteria bacterium]|jgi:PAS domain S-box-containing protein|nr:ATP-binding protein [Ignavibacteria bacterium]MDH7528621.1 ATP-binding protein [Ignavibacteria bacterium]